MKNLKVFAVITALIMLFTACSRANIHQNWQEQYDLGVRFLNEDNYEEAIIAFEAAIQIDPKNPEAYISLADVYIEKGDTDKAKEILEKGLENNPGNEEIIAKLDELTSETEVMTTTEITTTVPETTAEQTITTTVSSVEAEITTALSTEPPIEDPTLSEVKRMENLLRTGMTSNMLRYEEIMPFGLTLDTFRSSSTETIKNLIEQNGYDVEEEYYMDILDFNILDIYSVKKATISFPSNTMGNVHRISILDNFFDRRCYMRDIAYGDTMEDVLSKLGFSNGAEIAECINMLAEPEFDTKEELEAYCKSIFCQTYNDTIDINFNSCIPFSPDDEGNWKISGWIISCIYINGDIGTEVNFWFNTDKNDSMYNSLWMCDIDFNSVFIVS